jgi:hypothetical protein
MENVFIDFYKEQIYGYGSRRSIPEKIISRQNALKPAFLTEIRHFNVNAGIGTERRRRSQ